MCFFTAKEPELEGQHELGIEEPELEGQHELGIEEPELEGQHELGIEEPELERQHELGIEEPDQASSSKHIDLTNTNSLQQDVNKPTKRNNILIFVMTTPDLNINGLEVTGKIGDKNTRSRQKQVLDYKQANFELMKEELSSINYEVLMRNKNAEECYIILKEKIVTPTK
ncbi:hypothetical protein FHG87_002702 [Trinorchestia longiramus]|nr:hypothetical protein FHG87_002702 [Trinorchestia longiramus]